MRFTYQKTEPNQVNDVTLGRILPFNNLAGLPMTIEWLGMS